MTALEPGTVLAERFELLGVLGRGGMATVLLAHDRLRDERVALKVLHPHLAGDPSMRARLQREVQAAARVRHPGALVAQDLHSADGHSFLTLPYHPGQTLAERIASGGPLPAEQVRALGQRLAGALAQAHRNGVLHRDVNPNNVMIDADGAAVLVDFGLARLLGGASGHTTGVLGTTGYAAPEALDGRRGDPRSDLYGLGATLYLALTGQAPFAASTPLGVVQRQLDDAPTPPSTLGVVAPPDLEATVLALLSRDPEQRPQSAAQVVDGLAESRAPEALVAVSRPRLPPGDWIVVVGEKGDDKGRRQALRVERGQRPSTAGTDLEVFLRRNVWGGMKQALGIPEGLSSEQLLVRGLAQHAGLPPEALVPSDALFEPRFRLVERIDETTARSLQQTATQAGFKAQVFEITPPDHPRGLLRSGWTWTLVGLGITGAWGIGAGLSLLTIAAVVAAIGTLLLWGLTAPSAGERRDPAWSEALPLAFAALQAHLAPGHRVEASLVERVGLRLDRLQLTLDEGAADFTAAALASARVTLDRLRADAAALGERLASLDERLAAKAPGLHTDSELAWLASRRDRLETAQRAGEPVDAAELGRLTAELEDQADVAAVVEALQAGRTRTTTLLLELAGAAQRARQDLVRAREEDAPAAPVLARLARAREAVEASEPVRGAGRLREV